MTDPDPELAELIRALATARGAGKTLCPSEVARTLAPDAWRPLMSRVRAEAVRLAQSGEVAIYRKGRPVDPASFKGVYRIGLPPRSRAGDP